MKMFKYKIILACLLTLSMSAVFISCDDKPDTVASGANIDQLISARPELSIFKAALERTRLNQFTQGGGPFTVFAPTNEAFIASGISTAADLALVDSNLLVQIMTYHIQAGARSFTEIPLGPNATMSTQGGFLQYAARYLTTGKAYINGAEITSTNAAGNGFLYTINRVLAPGFASAATTLAANPNYKLMLQAITKTAVVTTTNPLTIFAVPNNVMIAAGYDSTTIANLVAATAPYTTLRGIMQYHTVNQRIFTPNFKAGVLKTVQTTNVIIGLGATVTVKGTNNPTPFNIVVPDMLTSTGVIHGIDGLLKP